MDNIGSIEHFCQKYFCVEAKVGLKTRLKSLEGRKSHKGLTSLCQGTADNFLKESVPYFFQKFKDLATT